MPTSDSKWNSCNFFLKTPSLHLFLWFLFWNFSINRFILIFFSSISPWTLNLLGIQAFVSELFNGFFTNAFNVSFGRIVLLIPSRVSAEGFPKIFTDALQEISPWIDQGYPEMSARIPAEIPPWIPSRNTSGVPTWNFWVLLKILSGI